MKLNIKINQRLLTSFLIILFLCFFQNLKSQEPWREFADKSDKFLKEKDFDNAILTAKQAIEECIKTWTEKHEKTSTLYGKLAKVYFLRGRYDDAIENYLKEQSILKEVKGTNNLAYAKVINNLSVVYTTIGKTGEVEKYLKESIKIKSEISGKKDTSYAKSLQNLAQFYQSLGKYPEAESLFLEAIDIKKSLMSKEDASLGTTFFNLGLLYKSTGDNTKALINFEKAKKIYEISFGETDPQTLSVYFNLAMIYIANGNNDKAQVLIGKSSEMKTVYMNDINSNTATALFNMAQNQIGLKHYDEGKKIFEELIPKIEAKLGVGNPLYSKSLRALGIIYWIQADFPKAYSLLEKTLELTKKLQDSNSIPYATALHNFAGLLKEMNQYEKAEEFYKKSFSIFKLNLDKFFPFFSEKEKANFYSLLKERFEMYNCFIIQRMEENPSLINDMYNFQIATKGVILNYSKKLRRDIYASGNEVLIKKYETWKSDKELLSKLYSMSKAELQKLGRNVDSLEIAINTNEKEISQTSKDFTKENDTIHYTWEDVRNNLKPNEAAVEIVRFKFFSKGWQDSTYYAALIVRSDTKDHPELVLFQNGNDMDHLYLSNYKKLIKSKLPDKKSYEVYWAKIAEKLEKIDLVYLSLDGVYNNISINSLLKANGKFVLDEKKLKILTNTAELIKYKNQVLKLPENPHATMFGFPKYKIENNKGQEKSSQSLDNTESETEISELPGTKEEVEKIKGILEANKWTTQTFFELNATENNIKSVSQSDLIHIATHGYFLSNLSDFSTERAFGVDVEKAAQNPLLRSGLLFAGASNFINLDLQASEKDENGILTAYEAMNLNLDKTQLVVLSACETGLGKIMNGEGVYGLQRSFQVAGAKNIIMSLWTVNDEVTQELMNNFYTNWVSGLDISTAFRNAQMKIKEDHPQPYYWGAFVLLTNN